MKERDVHAELSSIRDLMERSSKFISLSGLSGVLAGIFALAGAGWGYILLKDLNDSVNRYVGQPVIFWPMVMIALGVLVLSIVTCYWLSLRKATSRKENIWNPVSRRLLFAISIPLLTGGFYIGIMLMKGEYTHIASACLIFYGLALVAGSQFTFTDIKWLGLCQLSLGLLALAMPAYGLLLWAFGFGLLHIVYGSIMHFKYER